MEELAARLAVVVVVVVVAARPVTTPA